MEWSGIASAAAVPLALVGTIITAHLTRKTGKESNENSLMEQQRKMFQAMIDPLTDEVKELRVRVTTLEGDIRHERDIRSRILDYARVVLFAWRRNFPEDPPPKPPDSIAEHFN